MVSFPSTIQTILTLLGLGVTTGITLAVVFVAFRSKLPGATIANLQENNNSLNELAKTHAAKILSLEEAVHKLETENQVIKQLPLQKIADTQDRILVLLTTQNEILTKMSVTPAVQVNNK